MSDDQGLDEALCRLTALTAEQLDGLTALAAMDPADVATFQERIDAVWAANQQAVQDTRRQMAAARRAQAEIETRCGTAARARFLAAGGVGMCVLNDDELTEVQAARLAVAATEVEMQAAITVFKTGVTPDDLQAAV